MSTKFLTLVVLKPEYSWRTRQPRGCCYSATLHHQVISSYATDHVVALHWRHNECDASQITSLTIVYSTVYSCAGQRKHQSSASLAFERGNHRWPTLMAINAKNVSIWWRHHGTIHNYVLHEERFHSPASSQCWGKWWKTQMNVYHSQNKSARHQLNTHFQIIWMKKESPSLEHISEVWGLFSCVYSTCKCLWE